MWVTLGPIVLRLLFSVAISVAQRMGVMNKIDASLAKGAFNVEQFVSHLKTYPEYPDEIHKEGV